MAPLAGSRVSRQKKRTIDMAQKSIHTIIDIEKRCERLGVLGQTSDEGNYPVISGANLGNMPQIVAGHLERLLDRLNKANTNPSEQSQTGTKKHEDDLGALSLLEEREEQWERLYAEMKVKYKKLKTKHEDLKVEYNYLKETKTKKRKRKDEKLKRKNRELKKKFKQLKQMK